MEKKKHDRKQRGCQQTQTGSECGADEEELDSFSLTTKPKKTSNQLKEENLRDLLYNS